MTPLWTKLIAETPVDREFALKSLDNSVEYARQTGYVSPERLEKLAGYVATIRNDAAILENFINLFAIYYQGAPEDVLAEPFPAEFGTGIGDKPLLLVVAMSLIPTAEARFEKAGLPVSKLHETFDEIEAWIANCEHNYGITGLEFWHGFAWLTMRLFNCLVLRFGRLEYNKCNLFSDIMVLRHRHSGEFCVVLTEKYEVNFSGLVAAPGEETAFVTSFEKLENSTVTAHAVSADGIIGKDPVTFSPELWEIYLAPGDPVLYMHIPELGPLKNDAVKASCKAVIEFYRQYFPDYPVKAIVSHSWLFDPILRELLPETSNLLQFQRTGNLLPQKGPSDAVRRVLGQRAVDNGVQSVEWKTSLQKSLGNYLVSGGYCRGGGILIPAACIMG